jgi:multidrug transporter EmrE-like cation transporter
MSYLFWIFASAIAFACGEFLSKSHALDPRPVKLFAIFVAYNMGVFFWLPAIMQKKELAIVGTIWSVLSLMSTVLIGMILFNEKLNLHQGIGVILATASIIFLSR